jgi:hypothetical protein
VVYVTTHSCLHLTWDRNVRSKLEVFSVNSSPYSLTSLPGVEVPVAVSNPETDPLFDPVVLEVEDGVDDPALVAIRSHPPG